MLSLCFTLQNENLEDLVRQIASQTELPDEVVIVDSGKKAWAGHKKEIVCQKLNIKYLWKKCLRGEGRNLAAKVATHENIMFLDAGSVFDKNAVKEMSKSMKSKKSEIIAGRYASHVKNFKEYIFATFLNKDLSKKDVFYPSARIFGIKKKIFLKLKGFNEKMTSAEDTEFFKRAADHGFKIEKNLESLVFWNLPNYKSYILKIFTYAVGDAQSEIWWDPRKGLGTHNIKHLLTLVRWLILFGALFSGFYYLFGLLTFVYFASVAVKHQLHFEKFAESKPFFVLKNIAFYVIIKLSTDLFDIFGFIKGFF
jgi:hypothetical protein